MTVVSDKTTGLRDSCQTDKVSSVNLSVVKGVVFPGWDKWRAVRLLTDLEMTAFNTDRSLWTVTKSHISIFKQICWIHFGLDLSFFFRKSDSADKLQRMKYNWIATSLKYRPWRDGSESDLSPELFTWWWRCLVNFVHSQKRLSPH